MSAGSGTHSAAVADKSVKVTMRNLYPATQPDVDGRRMLRVTDATEDLAGEERAPVGAEGADKLKPLEQLLLPKTTSDHETGIQDSILLTVVNFFGSMLTLPKLKPGGMEEEVKLAKKLIKSNADFDDMREKSISIGAYRSAAVDDLDTKDPHHLLKRSTALELVEAYEKNLLENRATYLPK